MHRSKYVIPIILILFALLITSCEGLKGVLSTKAQPSSTFNPVSKMTIEERIAALIKEKPELLEVQLPKPDEHFMRDCVSMNQFDIIMQDASLEQALKYLESDIHYLRLAAHNRIDMLFHGRAGQNTEVKSALQHAYDNGSLRMKFELFQHLNDLRLSNERYKILDQIIADPDLPVFYGDLIYMQYRQNLSKKDLPIDAAGYYRKLSKSKYKFEREYASDFLFMLDSSFIEIIPLLDELLRGNELTAEKKAKYASKLGDFGEKASGSIPTLEKFIDDPSADLRISSAASLYLIGHKRDEMFRILSDQLKIDNPDDVLTSAITNLGRLGKNAKPVFKEITGYVKYKNAKVRNAAIDAIANIEGNYDAAKPYIVANLDSDDPEIIHDAISHLWQWKDKETTDKIASKLHDPHPEIVIEVCKALLNRDFDKKLIASAIAALVDKKIDDKYLDDFQRILESLGDDAEPAIAVLFRIMEMPDDYHPGQAMHLAIKLGVDKQKIAGKLTGMLSNRDAKVSKSVAKLLGELGGDAVSALQPLITTANKADKNDFYFYARPISEILAGVNSKSDVTLNTLYDALIYDCDGGFKNAERAILLFGGMSEKIAEKLGSFLTSENDGVVSRSLQKLESMDNPAAAFPYLCDFLMTNPRDYTKNNALDCVKKILENPKNDLSKHTSQMTALLKSDDPYVSRVVSKYAGTVKGDFSGMIDEYIVKVQSKDLKTAREGLDGLKDMKGKAVKAVPVLVELLEKDYIPDEPVVERQGAAYWEHNDKITKKSINSTIRAILEGVNESSNITVDELVKIADTDNTDVAMYAMTAIAKKINDPDKAIKKLLELARHPNSNLAARASSQIGKFGVRAMPYLDEIRKLPSKYPIPGESNRSWLGSDYVVESIYKNIKPEDDMETGKLLELMETTNSSEIQNLVKSVFEKTGNYDAVIKKLLVLAKHENPDIQSAAITNIGYLGTDAISALPELHKMPSDVFRTPNAKLMGAGNAIGNILHRVKKDTNISTDLILEMMEYDSSFVMEKAAKAIYEKTGSYDLAKKRLEELTKHENQKIRENAKSALKRIGK